MILGFPISLYLNSKNDKVKRSFQNLKYAILKREEYNEEEIRKDIENLLDKYKEYDMDVTKIKKDIEDIYNKYSYLFNDDKLKSHTLSRKTQKNLTL